MTTCPECNGEKGGEAYCIGADGARYTWFHCLLCGGEGEVDEATAARFRRGQQLRAERVAAEKGLRETAKEMGLTPTQLSKIERGVMDQPVRSDEHGDQGQG